MSLSADEGEMLPPLTTREVRWLVGRSVEITALGYPDDEPHLHVGQVWRVASIRMTPRGAVVGLEGSDASLVHAAGDRFKVLPK